MPFKRIVNIKCGDKTLELGTKTYIMGILNVTPDSFSDGGDFFTVDQAVAHAQAMVRAGADIIDVGGESTRPNHMEVSADEELKRILPIVKKLVQVLDTPISVDTSKAVVAKEVLKAGARIINDIWGLKKDQEMAEVIARYQGSVVIMHNQHGTEYEIDIIEEIKRSLKESVELALEAGVGSENIILDPGIGFGKTPEQNMVVMARLSEFNELGYPMLLGTSRKSMLGKILDLPPKERVEGTLATTVMGIMQGIDIVRVHDIKENFRAARVTDAIIRNKKR